MNIFKKKLMTSAVVFACGFFNASLSIAQQNGIKIIDRSTIELAGAKDVGELLASLVDFSGGITASQSVGGDSKGAVTASMKGIGDTYTLVLLNGRRIASYKAGGSVNLAPIPIASIERIEILNGISSAKYGSDGITGAVNIISKTNITGFETDFSLHSPQVSAAGKSQNFSLTKGWGDFEKQGFNATVTYSFDDKRELIGSDRPFSITGLRKFVEAGKTYSLFSLSSSSQPANANIIGGGEFGRNFNPNLLDSGRCNGDLVKISNRCFTDYAPTIDLLPAEKRSAVTSSFRWNINNHLNIFMDGLVSSYSMTAAHSSPVINIGIDKSSELFEKTVLPSYLSAGGNQPEKITKASASLRLVDAGRRTNKYKTMLKHWNFGGEGRINGWNYSAGFTHSENSFTNYSMGGYTSLNSLSDLIQRGLWSPFDAPSQAGKGVLESAILNQPLDSSRSKLSQFNVNASKNLDLDDGRILKLDFGFEAKKENFAENPSSISQGQNSLQPNWTDINIGGDFGKLPGRIERESRTAYAKIEFPISPKWQITTLARYDETGQIKNSTFDIDGEFIPSSKQGRKEEISTFNISSRFDISDSTQIFGSISTGYKPANLEDLTASIRASGYSKPRSFSGCIIPGLPLYHLYKACGNHKNYEKDPYKIWEFPLYQSSNPFLEGENSKQANFGIRYSFSDTSLFQVNVWDVRIANQAAMQTEDMLFNDVIKYRSSFIDRFDKASNLHNVAAILMPTNTASSNFRGIDWEYIHNLKIKNGMFGLNWTGTYMLKANTNSGLGEGEPKESSLDRFDRNGNVTFKLSTRFVSIWKPSDRYSFSLAYNYKSGYQDQIISSEDGMLKEVNLDGTLGDFTSVTRRVKPFYTIDFQSKIKYSKHLTLTAGIKNLFNQDPPFSLHNTKGGSQLGYDGRYADPIGRQFYVVGNLKF